jgi:uncharacterized protein YrrD
MTKNAKDLLNLPVITTGTAREMGTVDQVLFEPGQHQLYGVVVKRQNKSDPDLVVHATDIKSYGDQAVTIESEDNTVLFDADQKARELAPASGHLGNTRVLTEDGSEVGKIDTVLINEDGSIAAYRTFGGLLGLSPGKEFPPDQVVSASEDAIIVVNSIAQI